MVLNQIALLFTFPHILSISSIISIPGVNCRRPSLLLSTFFAVPLIAISWSLNVELVRHFRIDRHFRGAFEAFGGIWRHMALWKMEFSKLINLHIPFEKVLLSLTPPFRSWLWIQSSFLMKGLKRLKTSSGFRSAKLRTYEKTFKFSFGKANWKF